VTGASTLNGTLDVNVGGTTVDVNAEGLNVVVSAPEAAGAALAASAPASSLSVTQSSVSLLQGGENGITSTGTNTVVSGSGSSVTVSSSGVTLAGSGGGDLQLTGIADGIDPNAAVNRRQLDNAVSQLGSITGITSSGGNTVVTGSNSGQLNGGGNSVTVNSSGVNLAGSGGAALQLTGVADGTAPTSAVNRRQLDNLETEMSGGIASAMAMAQMPDPVPGSNYSVGLGAGFYNGESAFALGGAMYLENGVSLKAAYTYSSEGEPGFGLGAGFSW
jgi:autotransporter adhesin